ncbi:MAG: hypothetical protein M3O20_12500 [Acidobacteriota bacterium]|nr:hypothetical protein [Acidobacteriota bacterium]
MRKLFCTSSIFAGMVALLWSGFYFKHAATLWYWPGESYPNQQVLLISWLFMNLIEPLVALYIAGGLAWGLWKLSELLCSKLRANTKAEPLPQKEKV